MMRGSNDDNSIATRPGCRDIRIVTAGSIRWPDDPRRRHFARNYDSGTTSLSLDGSDAWTSDVPSTRLVRRRFPLFVSTMHAVIAAVSKHNWRILALIPILVSCDGDASRPPKPAEVLLTAGNSVLSAVGATIQITARILDGGGRQMDGQTVSRSSGNTSVVTVSPTGLALPVAGGTATITATSSPASGSDAGAWYVRVRGVVTGSHTVRVW
jgi:hypothetical protein